MTDLPTSYLALAGLALVLGLRHGFDADHLATIDGLTRLHRPGAAGAARWCGTLFSLGHGAVVVAVVAGLTQVQGGWQVPEWFQSTGLAVSLLFLFGLGLANLQALRQAPQGQPVQPVGWRSRWLGRMVRGRHPLAAVWVGALFALSFDTLSQAALFALAGQAYGPAGALLLALLFTAGMVLTDGFNGWWLARLIAGADARAVQASRVMCATVALVTLGVAVLGALRWASPALDQWADGRGLWIGLAVLLLTTVAGWRYRKPVHAVA
jgi:high-affinity nickel-transport protein